MLKHVVLFKFKEETDAAAIEELASGLGALPAIIDEIKEFVFGKDIIGSERSYDFGLVSLFDDLAAMQRYQVHPEHQKVIAHVKNICSSVVAVDFEC
ncbi:MAG: stress responsive alpha-beta barrel domain-containing protein [Desulfuromonas sp.]|nr:MAG: stress responsive alpha-beta barrel domain-containing protein [Desulfuromonas sp.]